MVRVGFREGRGGEEEGGKGVDASTNACDNEATLR